MFNTSQPTPYPEVNGFLTLLLSHMHTVLRDQFIGLYLGGSLAVGDFHPDRSDIDFVVIAIFCMRSEDEFSLPGGLAPVQVWNRPAVRPCYRNSSMMGRRHIKQVKMFPVGVPCDNGRHRS